MEHKTLIDWKHGLFLQPQHFQLNSLYSDYQLHKRYSLCNPYFWGIVNLDLDDAYLENKIISLRSAELILKDGTIVDIPGNAKLDNRSFSDRLDFHTPKLKVYLGVRNTLSTQSNVNESDADKLNKRYISVENERPFKDIFHNGPEANLNVLYYSAKLFFSDELENLQNYQLIPIMELSIEEGKVLVNNTYVPPCLQIGAVNTLSNALGDLNMTISEVVASIEKYKFPMDWYSCKVDESNFGYLFMLRTLSRYAPLLKHSSDQNHTHPIDIYYILYQFISELSFFFPNRTIFSSGGEDSLLAYSQDDLYTSIIENSLLLKKLLGQLSLGPERTIRLTKSENYYVADLPAKFIGEGNMYYMVIHTEKPTESLKDMLAVAGKLSAYSEIDSKVTHALPAINLEALSAAPEGVPKGANCFYFKINTENPFWRQLVIEMKTAFYPGNIIDDLVIDLYSVRSY